jgi:hypothetical protein
VFQTGWLYSFSLLFSLSADPNRDLTVAHTSHPARLALQPSGALFSLSHVLLHKLWFVSEGVN